MLTSFPSLPMLLKSLVCVLLAAGAASGQELRTFKSAKGVEIRARLTGVENGQATIVKEDGQRFTVPVGAFSAEDQKFILQAGAAMASGYITKASANDSLPAEDLNELAGAPIFGETVLWESDAESLAMKLKLRPESKTKTQSSFRSYPEDDFRLFGARPYSVALYAERGKPAQFSMVYANKGDFFGAAGSGEMHFDKDAPPKDAMAKLAAAMKKDIEAVTKLLSAKLGEPVKQRFGEGEGRRTVYRWDWRGHAILLSEVDEEYVGIEVATQAFADAGGKVARLKDAEVRAQAAANVARRENGDVVIEDIPMVDQGPKGYCVPATAERAMRYLGVPADMYVLAMAGGTRPGGGTVVSELLGAVGNDIRRKGRSFDAWNGELKLKELARHIDKGVPIIWGIYSTEEWNGRANERTKKRAEVKDWAGWKAEMEEVAKAGGLEKDRETAHVVLIIGYNAETNEIAFSDSWGERYKERWMTLAEGESISQQEFWVVGF
jgi:hypothetical protein